MSCSRLQCTILISGLNNMSCLSPFIYFSMPDQPPAKRRRGRPAATEADTVDAHTTSVYQTAANAIAPGFAVANGPLRARHHPSRQQSAFITSSPSSLVQPTTAEEVKTLQETVASLVSVVQHLATDAARRNTVEEPATVPSEQRPSCRHHRPTNPGVGR